MRAGLLVLCNSGSFTTTDFFQDFIGALGPDERLGILIVEANAVLDGGDEFSHAFKDTSSSAFAGNLAKPAFHQIEPGGTT